ncbi:MAG TPA: 2OG-Fe(II) oxygenase [Allosphingosinicella sp.]|jgi:prolyl 4-hydroxylase
MSSKVGDPGAIYRMQIGAWVKDRLKGTPNAFQIPAQGLDIFVVRDFLTKPECDQVIEKIDQDRVPSGLLAPTADPEFRTSESCNLRLTDRINQVVETKINALTGIPPTQGETIQGQRYAVGQQFKPHHDFFYPSEPYWPAQEKSGGQRTWTAMVFLNEPEGGGQTFFPRANVRVTPRTGNLLLWNNLDEFGQPNPYSLHTGMPVEAGTKYVITKWYRERDWTWWAANGVTPTGG